MVLILMVYLTSFFSPVKIACFSTTLLSFVNLLLITLVKRSTIFHDISQYSEKDPAKDFYPC